MTPNRARYAHVAFREALLVFICALGAWLFLHHDLLYLRGDVRVEAVPFEALLLSTFVLYVFVRGTSLAVGLRTPRISAGAERCPECGQLLEDGTPLGAHPSRDVENPRPRVREVRVRPAPGWAENVIPPAGSIDSRIARGPPLPSALRIENPPSNLPQMGPPDGPSPVRRTVKVPWTPKSPR